jgi:hypothetical protein
MKQCNDIENYFYDYNHNQLTDQERNDIEEHLKHCEACQKEYEDYQKITKILYQWKPPELPKDFRRHVNELIAERVSIWEILWNWISQPIRIPAGAIVTAIAIFAIAVYLNVTPPIPIENTKGSQKPLTVAHSYPVTIETIKAQEAFAQLENLLKENNGEILKKQTTRNGIRVVVKWNQDEALLFEKLKPLGEVKKPIEIEILFKEK